MAGEFFSANPVVDIIHRELAIAARPLSTNVKPGSIPLRQKNDHSLTIGGSKSCQASGHQIIC